MTAFNSAADVKEAGRATPVETRAPAGRVRRTLPRGAGRHG